MFFVEDFQKFVQLYLGQIKGKYTFLYIKCILLHCFKQQILVNKSVNSIYTALNCVSRKKKLLLYSKWLET